MLSLPIIDLGACSLIITRNIVLMSDAEALKKVCWNGIPHQHRPMAWRLLLDYLPTNSERRDSALAKKRQEYA